MTEPHLDMTIRLNIRVPPYFEILIRIKELLQRVYRK